MQQRPGATKSTRRVGPQDNRNRAVDVRRHRRPDIRCQRIVTCRLASPERAARSSDGQRRVVRQRLGQGVGEGRGRLLQHLRAGARGPGPTPGASSPWARNMPDQPGARRPGVSRPAACSRARASSSGVLGLRASPSAGAPWCPRRSSTPPRPPASRAVGVAAALACSRAAASAGASSSTSATQKSKPSCTVTSSGVAGDQVLQPRARRRAGRSARRCPGSAVERLEQHGAQVAAGVAEVVLDLEPQPDLAAVADHRRRRHRQQRAELDARGRSPSASAARWRPAPARAARSTSHSDGSPSNGRRDEGGGRAAGGAVAGLVAPARAAGARLTRPDLAPAVGGLVTGLGA